MTTPDWVEHVVWWQVYPLGFAGAEKAALPEQAPARHGLTQLVPWLDYLVEMGASGLALGPVFASETHGYDTTDYYRIDSRLGDDADFDELVAQAHARGIRVLLDGVFNHTGRSFAPFRQALEQGPGATTADWFGFIWPDGWTPGTEPDYKDFEGHHHLVALNHAEPAVADFVADVMKHWLRRGADGWRLDAAYAVPSPFWAKVLDEVRTEFPDAYFVGEYIHGNYPEDVRAGHLDSVTQYELWKAIWSSLAEANFYELSAALERHNTFLDTFVPLTFVGNHDVTRIASRLAPSGRLAHALVLLFTLPGTPTVYYGDEQGYRGDKEDRAGGDDDIRPSFPASPEELSAVGQPLYHLHQELIGLRRRHHWVHAARTRVHSLANEQLVYEVFDAGHSLFVAMNLEDTSVTVQVPEAARDVLAGAGGLDVPGRQLALPAKGWAILGPAPAAG
ncbi:MULTISPECIES: alpha-amylase family glycosyl hydrolase [unclassified Arthrobacter]|uniref:alpha-amylase family glycosyl hydrolase n=1 Tax=unclassified Arthrobacter TaxID=235627 RepID=UPI002105356C|nr:MULTISPECIES: alpha-amylase family glycosyl hydrolase [unclassified Arthrobacter]MCQ1946879.1 alpha-amylase family glycosyl hydrolase [Arthrobacter sp. zg-Y1116]MCQ1986970.1 alpha-amylase family glycosyl hydrolase [Arthrobacter sp. zg-Y844]